MSMFLLAYSYIANSVFQPHIDHLNTQVKLFLNLCHDNVMSGIQAKAQILHCQKQQTSIYRVNLQLFEFEEVTEKGGRLRLGAAVGAWEIAAVRDVVGRKNDIYIPNCQQQLRAVADGELGLTQFMNLLRRELDQNRLQGGVSEIAAKRKIQRHFMSEVRVKCQQLSCLSLLQKINQSALFIEDFMERYRIEIVLNSVINELIFSIFEPYSLLDPSQILGGYDYFGRFSLWKQAPKLMKLGERDYFLFSSAHLGVNTKQLSHSSEFQFQFRKQPQQDRFQVHQVLVLSCECVMQQYFKPMRFIVKDVLYFDIAQQMLGEIQSESQQAQDIIFAEC